MRVIHISDVHLGYQRFNKVTNDGINQREFDVVKTFEEVVYKTASLNPDLVIISGDLFDSTKPSNFSIVSALQIIRNLRNTRVVIISGNHDKPKKREIVSPVECLKFYDNVYVITSNSVLRLDDLGCVVYCICQPDSAFEFLRETYGYKNYKKILTLHTLVKEVDDRAKLSISDLNSVYPMDYIAMGDLHECKEVLLNAWYSGSLDWVSNNFWSEIKTPKVFLEVNIKPFKVIAHRVISTRKVVVFDPIDCKNLSKEDVLGIIEANLREDLSDALVKVSLVNCTREHLTILSSTRFRNLKSKTFVLQVDTDLASSFEAKIPSRFFKSTIFDEFQDFIKNYDIKSTERELLLEKFKNFISNENR